MAINETTKELELLNPRLARMAGALSILLGLACAAAAIAYMVFRAGMPAEAAGFFACLAIVQAVVIGAGVNLLRGRPWAQRFLLAWWLVVACGAVVHSLGALLWGAPPWWDAAIPLAAVTLPVIVLGAAASALVAACSLRGSRLRYGTFATISIPIAVVVVVVINMIAQTDPIHKDLETLGSYGISERTKNILAKVDQPLRITCVYTSADEKKLGADFRPRVMDLLEEMQIAMSKQNKQMEVVNVTSDAEKAKLLARLRSQLGGQASKHVELLQALDARTEQVAKDLKAEIQAWSQLPEDSYLRLWNLPADMQSLLADMAQRLEDLRLKVRREMSGTGLPDYAKLIDEVKRTAEAIRDPLDKGDTFLAKVAEIPTAATANKQAALDSVKKASEAYSAMAASLGGGGATSAPASAPTTGPADATKALQQFIAAADVARARLVAAAKGMEELAGPENTQIVTASDCWLVGRADLSSLYHGIAQGVEQFKQDAQSFLSKATPEAQAEMIQKVRPNIESVGKLLDQTSKSAVEAVNRLSTIDGPTKAFLHRGEGGRIFGAMLTPMNALLAEVANLPAVQNDTVAADIAQDNIVIVEVAGKMKVVPFDEVWPLRVKQSGAQMNDKEEQKRSFNGDSVISSRILCMTQKPFATVLFAYLQPDQQTMRMMQMSGMARSLVTPQAMTTLKKRLEDANFEVAEWDLAGDRPAPTEGRPQVLVILPPAPPMPQMQQNGPPPANFGPEQVEKIRKAIDAGTPAVFMARYTWPMSMGFMSMPVPYGLNDYLGKDWGLHAENSARVVMGVPDEATPGLFRVSIRSFGFLPLSSFSDHPIGRPLQAQRVLWNDVCPIVQSQTVPGVKSEPLLSVPAGRNDIWAAAHMDNLVKQVETKGVVTPEADDFHAPFEVAVVATRSAEKDKPEARIVVLGMSASLMDGYLDQQVPLLGAEGEIAGFADPPTADADVVSNSADWLSGHGDSIAAGPVLIKPVNITPQRKAQLWTVCVIGLPLLVLLAGGMVLLKRRR